MDFEEDNERYARARRLLPGLLGTSKKRETFLASVTACSLLFTGFMWLKTSSDLAAVKLEKSQGWVAACDGDGNVVKLPVASANEYRLSDGLVFKRLEEVVRCMHGLDRLPKVVRDCWEREKALFVGEAAQRFEAFGQERFPSVDAILRQQQLGSIVVDIESRSKPEPAAPNRYWLRWKRQTVPHNGGTPVVEVWSGTFDVELIPMQRTDTSGMRITWWEWHQDTSGSAVAIGAR